MLRGRNQHLGITLTELIIATMVVGVVMMGVVSADFAIRRHSESAFTSASSSINLQSIGSHIINNASKAIGTGLDRGILIGSEISIGSNSFCVRTTTAPTWVCYTGLGAGSFFTCNKPSASICVGGDPGYTDLGTVISVTPTFTLDGTLGTQQAIFNVEVIIADTSSSTGTRTFSASISPPAHSI